MTEILLTWKFAAWMGFVFSLTFLCLWLGGYINPLHVRKREQRRSKGRFL